MGEQLEIQFNKPKKRYYNTTHLEGVELEKLIENAKNETVKILAFFRSNPGERYTPFEIQTILKSPAPITSIRRAISTLTKEGYLIKTTYRKAGPYNTLNYTWKLRQENE